MRASEEGRAGSSVTDVDATKEIHAALHLLEFECTGLEGQLVERCRKRNVRCLDTFDLFRLVAKTVLRECIQLNHPINHNKISCIHPTQVEVLATRCRRRCRFLPPGCNEEEGGEAATGWAVALGARVFWEMLVLELELGVEN